MTVPEISFAVTKRGLPTGLDDCGMKIAPSGPRSFAVPADGFPVE